MSQQPGQIVDRSTRCFDSTCPQRHNCARWRSLEIGRGLFSFAVSLRPRGMAPDGDCIFRIPASFNTGSSGNADI